jgi:RNA polymerase nonessential primary-like sigma factor
MRGTTSLTHLLNDYGKRQIPTPSEELHWGGLVRQWLDHPDGPDYAPAGVRRAGLRARNRLVEGNVRWVVAIAKKHCRFDFSDERLMDAIQFGVFGLIRAIERFDPTRGYKLSTFSYFWILQGIQRGEESRGVVRLPDTVVQQCRKVETAIQQLREQGIRPTRKRIAEATGISETLVAQRIQASPLRSIGSLDAIAANSDDKALIELIADEATEPAEAEIELEILRAWLDSNLDCLSTKQRQVFERLQQGQERQAIAAELGVSRSSVGAHQKAAIEKLQQLRHQPPLPLVA